MRWFPGVISMASLLHVLLLISLLDSSLLNSFLPLWPRLCILHPSLACWRSPECCPWPSYPLTLHGVDLGNLASLSSPLLSRILSFYFQFQTLLCSGLKISVSRISPPLEDPKDIENSTRQSYANHLSAQNFLHLYYLFDEWPHWLSGHWNQKTGINLTPFVHFSYLLITKSY